MKISQRKSRLYLESNEKIREVIINVNAKDFVIRCADDFASFLETDIDLLSKGSKKIELKEFVNSYIAKSYEQYKIHKQVDKIIKTINAERPFKVIKK